MTFSSLGSSLNSLLYFSLVQPHFLAYFNNPTSSETGGIVAAFSAGATFGAFGCSYIGDPIGRVWALRIGAAIAVIGCALQAGSVHVWRSHLHLLL